MAQPLDRYLMTVAFLLQNGRALGGRKAKVEPIELDMT
jgi:hypothetical protein